MTRLKTRSALSYFGSDSEVASQLAGMLSGCRHVTIPFVGGAAILPHLTARAIVANDVHSAAINFYRVVSGCFGEQAREALIDRCEHTLSRPFEMEAAMFELGADRPGSWE